MGMIRVVMGKVEEIRGWEERNAGGGNDAGREIALLEGGVVMVKSTQPVLAGEKGREEICFAARLSSHHPLFLSLLIFLCEATLSHTQVSLDDDQWHMG